MPSITVFPDDPEVYIHRSGRTGRAGKCGISVSILHMKENGKLKQIEKLSGKKFIRKMIPSGEEICEKQLFHLVNGVVNVETQRCQIEQYLPQILEQFEGLDTKEIVKRFVSVEFNKFLSYYKNARDLNVAFHEKKKKAAAPRSCAFQGFLSMPAKNRT
jgi:ATP-dependent RNA helicase DeaD